MDDPLDPSSTLPARFGRYHVLSAIQGGAMGKLYLAQDPEIDRMVVVKALDSGSSAEQKMRFLREAKAAGRLNHPNVVAIFDVGEQDRTPFIVMEYIEGETLSSIIKNREPIPFSRRLEISDQLCAGLAYAHDQGVVHRDIKPSNLMLDKSGKLRILDFGIARLDTSDATQTSTGIIGTLNYMSPEQWEAGVIEGRSDMFSVGAVMYELFSFTKAFPGNTPPEVMRYMFGEGPRPLQEVCPLAPAALADVVARMMARSAEQRYPSLHEVREALAAVRPEVQGMPTDSEDATLPIGGQTAAWAAPTLPRPRGTQPITTPATGTPMRAAGPTGWPVLPPQAATGTQVTQVTHVTQVPINTAPPAADTGRTIRLVAIGAVGVIVVGLIGWLALRGSTGAGGGAVNPPSSPPATATVAQPPAAGGQSATGTTPPAGRGTPAEAGAAAVVPSKPVRTDPVHLVISWSRPFIVTQGGKPLSKARGKRQDLADVHPDRGDVYADDDELRLHERISTDKSDQFRLKEPGLLAVDLPQNLNKCWVMVDGRQFRKGTIPLGLPAAIAAGKHQVSVKCDNGTTEPAQSVDVKSGFDAAPVSFVIKTGGN